MTNEIQIQPSGLPAQADLWGQPTSAQPQTPPLKKIHRLLRGRYPLVIILSLVCAVVGGVLGYKLPPVTYQSNGLVEIKPFMPSILDFDRVMPMYNSYVTTQSQMLSSQRVLEAAINSEDWKRHHPGSGIDDLAKITQNLDVQNVRNSQLVRVSYTDEKPEAAQGAVRAIINAYMSLYGDIDSRERRNKIDLLETRQNILNNSIRAKRNTVIAMAERYGTVDLAPLHNARTQELVSMEANLEQVRLQLKAAEVAVANKQNKMKEIDQMSLSALVTQIAQADPQMRAYLRDRENMEIRREQLARTFGANHKLMVDADADMKSINQRIDKYAHEFVRSGGGAKLNIGDIGGAMISNTDLETMRTRVADLENVVKRYRDETLAMGKQRLEIASTQNEIDGMQGSLAATTKRIEELNAEAAMAGRISVASYGDRPTFPAADKSRQFAALGIVLGGALPIALFLLIGLASRSYRYSDDTDEDMSGLNMLGILPDLPDRLNDPEQAGIAAHCVHQIRTMLQINGRNESVIAITSAQPGDGKTSLALSLGLSYAACGSNTLLIDCDLIGAGLTTRLNLRPAEGILEAVANRNLLPYVQNTDITNVAVLPVGSAQKLHASTLSPIALKRLIAECRKHFETIIIDTGPILGSIEASLVAAAADRVILTVSAGTKRPLVERTLAHLRSIGANIAGVVFNRAEARDFERTLGATSMRSTGGGNSGPTVDKTIAAPRAVASAIKPSSSKRK